jgi:hypothetical protein
MTRVKGEQLHIPEAQAEPDIPLVVVVTYDEQEEHAIAMPVEASPLTKKKTASQSQNQQQHHQDSNNDSHDDGEFQ